MRWVLLMPMLDTSRDYDTWFAEFSTRPIIGNVPVSGDRVLGGIVRAQGASEAECRLRAKALQVRVTKLEIIAAAREVRMQEETAWALTRERELWQSDRKAHAIITERGWS